MTLDYLAAWSGLALVCILALVASIGAIVAGVVLLRKSSSPGAKRGARAFFVALNWACAWLIGGFVGAVLSTIAVFDAVRLSQEWRNSP